MTSIAVIGAGMAGLVCANALQQAGAAVTVFEKSRGVGGRGAWQRAVRQLVRLIMVLPCSSQPVLRL